MSPAAVMTGAATLSMSHPQRADPAATPTVMARTTAEEITPPTIEMTTKSSIEIESRSKATVMDLASAARARETTNVSVRADRTFWPTIVERRRDRVNVPV